MISTPGSVAVEPRLNEPTDFSLVLGGPLYQLLRRAHMAGDALQLLRRRIVAFLSLTWVPLLLLSVVEGHVWGDSVQLPFFYDLEQQVRLLVALPLLIVAELIVHQRIRDVVAQFLERDLIPATARAQFDAAIASAMRLRNSITAEVLLIAFVYIVGLGVIWRTQTAIDVAVNATSWYGAPVDGTLRPTLAGWWLALVSLPMFQFLFMRWYFRMFIWARFLWQVSRIELKILPTHPDRCGGLSFLVDVTYAFSPLLLAQGSLLAGMIANRIFYAGSTLLDFKVEVVVLVAVMLSAVLGPLMVFSGHLADVKRAGLRYYGTLAQRHAREFDEKWRRGGATADEPLVGSPDISSLADMDSSFNAVKGMKAAPIDLNTVVQLAVITLAPLAPLALTMFSMEQLFEQVVKIIF